MKVAFASCLVLLAAPVSIEVTYAVEKDQTLDEVVVRRMRLKAYELRKMIVGRGGRYS